MTQQLSEDLLLRWNGICEKKPKRLNNRGSTVHQNERCTDVKKETAAKTWQRKQVDIDLPLKRVMEIHWPQALINMLWFKNSSNFGIRGGKEQNNLILTPQNRLSWQRKSGVLN